MYSLRTALAEKRDILLLSLVAYLPVSRAVRSTNAGSVRNRS